MRKPRTTFDREVLRVTVKQLICTAVGTARVRPEDGQAHCPDGISYKDSNRWTVAELMLTLDHLACTMDAAKLGPALRQVRKRSLRGGTKIIKYVKEKRGPRGGKKLRSDRGARIEQVTRVLGRIPVVRSQSWEHKQPGNRMQYYGTKRETYAYAASWLREHVGVWIEGTVLDPCCGPDDRVAYALTDAFPTIQKLVLKDKYHTTKEHREDLIATVRSINAVWIVTSPPYTGGTTMADYTEALVHSGKNVLLKLSHSGLATRESRAKWWPSKPPTAVFCLDPIQYKGYGKEQRTTEDWVLWLNHTAEELPLRTQSQVQRGNTVTGRLD